MSWYAAHLDASLDLIESASLSRRAAIIDIGGGESTLVDDLLVRGYKNVTVLDISQAAIDSSKERVGRSTERVQWITADVSTIEFDLASFDLWHDRAVFHFLTSSNDRATYVRQVARALKPGGHLILGTFGLDGPARCSGLSVVRYDATSLLDEFGERFQLVKSIEEQHRTPFGTIQPFLYCHFRHQQPFL